MLLFHGHYAQPCARNWEHRNNERGPCPQEARGQVGKESGTVDAQGKSISRVFVGAQPSLLKKWL